MASGGHYGSTKGVNGRPAHRNVLHFNSACTTRVRDGGVRYNIQDTAYRTARTSCG